MLTRESCKLRPMRGSDLRTVFGWRNSERIRAVSFTEHEIAWEEHLAWYERCKTDDTIHPMLFECHDQPIGVVSISRIDRSAGTAEWGFYLGDLNAPKGSGAAMGFLALEHAFGELGLEQLVGEAFVSNEASVRYHERLGFRAVEAGRRRVKKGDEMLEVMRLQLSAERWRELRPSLDKTLFPEVKA